MGYLFEKLLDDLGEQFKQIKEDIDLRKEISEFLNKQQYEFNDGAWEYDFEAFIKQLTNSLLKDEAILQILDAESRDDRKKIIYRSCIQAALEKSNEKDVETYDTSTVQPLSDNATYCLHLIEPVHGETALSPDVQDVATIPPIHKSRFTEVESKIAEIIEQCINIIIGFYRAKNTKEDILKAGEIKDTTIRQATRVIETLKPEIQKLLSEQRENQQPKIIQIQSDNRIYLERFSERLFLEEKNSTVTLQNMYIPPFEKESMGTASASIREWFNTTESPCMVLYGNAGIGKSSLISKILADANGITELQMREFDFMPDQICTSELRNHCDAFRQWLQNASVDETICRLFAVEKAADLYGKLLILDGFDELTVLIPEFHSNKAAEFIESLVLTCDELRILITTREGYFDLRQIDESARKLIAEKVIIWNDSHVNAWCERYSQLSEAKQPWCIQFKNDYETYQKEKHPEDARQDIFCIPIILYLSCATELELKKEQTIGQIYDYAFRQISLREHIKLQKKSDPLRRCKTDQDLRIIHWQYAKELAYQMFLRGTQDLLDDPSSDDPRALGLQNAKERTKIVLQDRIEVSDEDLESTQFQAVFPFSESGTCSGITFAHKTVYEYFTAVKLYEDYFSKFNRTYFKDHADTKIEDVMSSFVEAFRYKELSYDIIQYLCKLEKPAFVGVADHTPNSDETYFCFEEFAKTYSSGMEQLFFSEYNLAPRIEEYIAPEQKDVPINAQLSLAFCNLTWFLTGHGYINPNGISKGIADLISARFMNVNLSQWILSEAEMAEANLKNAVLEDTDLHGANLKGANLQKAILKRANLKGANLEGADLRGAILQGAILYGANLEDANLQNADLRDVNLKDANLEDAQLDGTILENSNLIGAILYRAQLTFAQLTNADLSNSSLISANMRYIHLAGANLQGANLGRANLEHMEWEGADFEGAIFYSNEPYNTIFPDEFNC